MTLTGQLVERRERRFVVDDTTAVAAVLAERGFVRTAYGVRTLYLEAVAGSTLRLREYDASGVWWLEHKARRDDLVRKIRHRLGRLELTDLAFVAEVTYRRTAYERGGARITIDEGLRQGTSAFPSIVVEVKGKAAPRELRLPAPDLGFSKYRWATGRYPGARDLAPQTR